MKHSRLRKAESEIEYNYRDVMDMVESLRGRMVNNANSGDYYTALSEAKNLGEQISSLASFYMNNYLQSL